MTDDEFDAFVRYLAEEYVKHRLPRTGRRLRPHFEDELSYVLDRLRSADLALNYIKDAIEDDDDIYDTFTLKALTKIILDADAGVALNNRLAETCGLMDVMDGYFAELAEGMRASHLPAAEADMLSSLGFPRVAGNLDGLVCEVKIFSRKRVSRHNEVPVSQQLRDLAHRIDVAHREHREASERTDRPAEPLRKRKWWTGLGKVVTGTAVSLADIGLAIGVLPFDVPAEARSSGAIMSAVAGIGQVLEGVGAIRGE